jgi:hypothetical protein
MKRRLAIGLAVIAAAAAGGGAYAATRSGGSSNDAKHQAFLNDVAKRLHVTPEQLRNALKGAAVDRLNAALASGRITQAQANQLKQRIEQGQLPPFGEHRMHGFGGAPVFPALIGAANFLGLTPPQLLHQLESGKSLGQIAAARGKSVSGLKAAIIAQIRSRLDQAVARGIITRAREQQILSDLSSRLDDLITRVHQPGFGGHRLAAPQMAQPPAGPMPPAGPTF